MMNCELAQRLLHERMDREGPEATDEGLEAHLEACAECHNLAADLDRLQAQTTFLPRQIQPESDLWAAISERIGAPAERIVVGSARPSWWLWAASVAAVLALIVGAFWFGAQQDGGPAGKEQVTNERLSKPELLVAGSELERACAQLTETIRKREKFLSPYTLETVERNLEIIDAAVAQIRRAMEYTPDDPRLLDMVSQVRRRELDYLKRMAHLQDLQLARL